MIHGLQGFTGVKELYNKSPLTHSHKWTYRGKDGAQGYKGNMKV